MRLTIRLDDDVYMAAKITAAQQNSSIGHVINDLAPDGLKVVPDQEPFRQKPFNMGMKVDCTNVSEVLAG
ncbi:hypothetical protein QP994_06605 [Corynebacterium sp. MSK044]|uniref:hypothetical protein n=1 Tax=Corynebacterium sp. MSK044 TaxID=3050195 RepID=UPI00254E3E92|nr:hypothetical protein [Corynebacterium sp. MSK044]MDK8797554.1 hypothetical protein [Corynebacterium sp. MSK044]